LGACYENSYEELFVADAGFVAGTIFAQSSGAPLYPADPHPAQVPNTGQDQAPTEMNQGTGQNEPGQTQPGQKPAERHAGVPGDGFGADDEGGELPEPGRVDGGGFSRKRI